MDLNVKLETMKILEDYIERISFCTFNFEIMPMTISPPLGKVRLLLRVWKCIGKLF